MVKPVVDYCIDHCGQLHNIRETLFHIRKTEASSATLDTQALLNRGATYMARYVLLIVLSSFLRSQDSKLNITFREWTDRHPQYCKYHRWHE